MRQITYEEKAMISMIAPALSGRSWGFRHAEPDWEQLIDQAERHKILPLLYPVLEKQPVSEAQMTQIQAGSQKVVLQSYHLLFFSKYVLNLLKENQIPAVLLKGASAAMYYPVPELRKSGDVDILLLDAETLEAAKHILLKNGFTVLEEQTANHHLAMEGPDGIELEMHILLAEPFDNERINRYLKKLIPKMAAHVEHKDIMGVTLPVLSDGYLAFELLLHMLQHFLRSGFGLKLLCDWVVFWNRPVDTAEIKLYLELLREARLVGFSRMITSVCVHYLGLRGSGPDGLMLQNDRIFFAGGLFCVLNPKSVCREFLMEILDAEEFGKSEKDRMVVLRSNRISDYIREFHHQMRLNYPKAGKHIWLWPVLWPVTLLRFLYNNKKIRNISTIEILKKAGDRSRLIEQMYLFRRDYTK